MCSPNKFFLLLALCALSPALAHAEEFALDPPYKHLIHPRLSLVNRNLLESVPRPKNDVLALIAKQTPLKAQAARGSCSIFSAIALLESMLVIQGKADASLDLSEEYLQYLIAQYATDDGSNSLTNFSNLHEYGSPSEEKMPYIGLTWKTLADGDAQKRCGHLADSALAHCLTGHRDPALLLLSDAELANPSAGVASDPEFLMARTEALENKKRFFSETGRQESGFVFGTNDIKELLGKGIPVTLDIDFYYGSWNHNRSESMGINRDLDQWAKGVVGYPEHDSMDRAQSRDQPAGHSVVVVGYDDDREVEYTVKMTDGSMKTFKRKGVYYFKNSWGPTAFGVNNEIEGQTFPGYGIITQDYANEFGQFFKLVL